MTADIGGSKARVAVFAGPIGRSHRQRDNEERRFQNPGKNRPIQVDDNATPLLVGLWDDEDPSQDQTILSVAEIDRRIGRRTRFSVFTPLETLRDASRSGWAEVRSDSDERIICFQMSELADFLQLYLSADAGEGQVLVPALQREASRVGLEVAEIVAVLREERTIRGAQGRTGLAAGVLQAIYEQTGRPFLLASLPTPATTREALQSLWYLQTAAEALGVSILPASSYDAFARTQTLTIEEWPRHGAIARMHGGWIEACETAGLEAPERSRQELRYPAQRCREFLDRYIEYCVATWVQPSSSGYLAWRAGNGGPSLPQVEAELGPIDEQIRHALNRHDG